MQTILHFPMSLAILLEQLLKTQEQTCFGTHRLGALAKLYARKELLEDKDIAKLWPELERQVLVAVLLLKQSQRPDGDIELPDTMFGVQPQDDIYYTGHSLERMTFLGEDYYRDDWVVRAADYFGGLSHAVSALKRWYGQAK